MVQITEMNPFIVTALHHTVIKNIQPQHVHRKLLYYGHIRHRFVIFYQMLIMIIIYDEYARNMTDSDTYNNSDPKFYRC